MNKNIFLGAIFSLLLASCSNELEVPQNKALGRGNAPLQISVVESTFTKATGQNTGTSLPDGSEIGVFVTASDGASYDSQYYNNIKYTATGTGVGQTWAYDVNTPVDSTIYSAPHSVQGIKLGSFCA